MNICRSVAADGAGILFFIHGGGFFSDSSEQYDGISHRIFGFMSFYNPQSRSQTEGNYGILDQQLALKHVHHNGPLSPTWVEIKIKLQSVENPIWL